MNRDSKRVQVLVQYWEWKPGQIGSKLDEFKAKGLNHVAATVPWQHLESDITHALPRFLQALRDRNMSATLILTPELGVAYPYSGLPRDLVTKAEHQSQTLQGKKHVAILPPVAFALPSMFSQGFQKRYQNYLSRLDSVFADVQRLYPGALDRVSLCMGGGLFKSYRDLRYSVGAPFGVPCEDGSREAQQELRTRTEAIYSQKEFSALARWKSREMEPLNRRQVHQLAEDFFRARGNGVLRRKARDRSISNIEYLAPEADPAYALDQALELTTGMGGSSKRFGDIIDAWVVRSPCVSGEVIGELCPPWVAWTGHGAFRGLSDTEKQFVFLRSLLQCGARGGGVFVEDGQWFGFSATFRRRVDALAAELASGKIRAEARVAYLTAHLWSPLHELGGALHSRAPHEVTIVSSIEAAFRARGCKTLVVDPEFVVTRAQVLRLLEWCRAGNTVVMPRSPLFSPLAREEMELALTSAAEDPVTIETGLLYRLVHFGMGKWILYDVPGAVSGTSAGATAMATPWELFAHAIAGLAETQFPCQSSDDRVECLAFHRSGGGLALFVLNPTPAVVSADLHFRIPVTASDLAQGMGLGAASGSGRSPAEEAQARRYSNRLHVEVPAYGVLPIAIDWVGEWGMESELARREWAPEVTADLPGVMS